MHTDRFLHYLISLLCHFLLQSLIVCICQVFDIWGSGSVFISPFFPCQTVMSSNFLLLCFRVNSIHETTPTDFVYSCCLDLCPSLSHCLSFLLYHYPSGFFRLFCVVLGGSNLQIVSVWQGDPLSVFVQSTSISAV